MAKTQTPTHHNKIDHKCKYIKYSYGHPKVKYNSGCSCRAMDGTTYNSITIILFINSLVCMSVEVPILSFRTSTDRRTDEQLPSFRKSPSSLHVCFRAELGDFRHCSSLPSFCKSPSSLHVRFRAELGDFRHCSFLRENAAFLFLYYNSAQSLMVLLNGPPLSNFVDRGLGEWEWLGPGSIKIRSWSSKMGPVHSHTTQRRSFTETRFTQHGPVLISGCGFTQHG